VLVEGLELELEAGLALDGVLVALGEAFEKDAPPVGGLPDGFEFVEAQEAGQGEGIAAVVLVVILADEVLRRASQTTSCWTWGLRSWPSQRARLDSSSMSRLSVAGMACTCAMSCWGWVGNFHQWRSRP
jgi:hypothetical protein